VNATRNGDTSAGGGRGEEPDSSRPKIRLPLALSKLPPGRHDLPREFVRENQRARLLSAALSVFGERGYVKTSVATLIKEAGISRATFYSLYPDKAGCFLASYDLALEWLEAAARAGVDQAESWPPQVLAATKQVLALLASDPKLARLCTVEVHFAGPEVSARHREVIGQIGQALRPGRRCSPDGKRLTDLLEPALASGVSALIAAVVAEGEAKSLERLAPDLTELLLTAYLGPTEARRIARGRR
jgi:AcrR family transcriptional regulator